MLKLIAFIKKDFLVTISYRFNVILHLAGLLLSVFLFFFIGKTFSGAISPYLARYGGDYFPYVLIGIAVSNFVTVGLNAFAGEIRKAQMVGTLEALISTPTSIYTVLIGNSLWSFLSALFSAILLICAGFIIIQLQIVWIHAFASLFVLILTFATFLTIGMLSASFVIIFKRGDPISYIFGWSSFFFGGVLFPVEVLPQPFQYLSKFLPITHAVKAIRELLLAKTSISEIMPLIFNLLLFILIITPVSILFFRYAVNRAKRDGNLVQY